MQHLLLIKTSSLGDVVHAFPAVTDLARHLPGLTIDWMVEESFAELPRLHPAIRRVIPVALRRWRSSFWAAETRAQLRLVHQVLDALEHDASLDLQGLIKSAMMGRYGPKRRLGYDWHSIREPLASLFYSEHFAVPKNMHAVERNRHLAGAALGYRPTTAVDYGLHHALERPASLQATPYVVFLHGTSKSTKEWPLTHWITLGKKLSAQGFSVLLPGGNAQEKQRAHQLAASIPGAHALQSLDLTTLASILAHAHSVVGVDTGLTHLATALGRPVVAVYTATDPAATGVYGSPYAINLGGIQRCPTAEEVVQTLALLAP